MIGVSTARFDPDVEAAMQRAYGVDTLDPSVTPRRLWVLLQRLPAGFWPDRESAAHWSMESHLLAAAIDAIHEVTWVLATVNSKRKPKHPKPVPRPGAKPERKIRVADLAGALSGVEGVRADG